MKRAGEEFALGVEVWCAHARSPWPLHLSLCLLPHLACLCLNGLAFRVCIFIPMRNPRQVRPRAPPCSCLRARAPSSSSCLGNLGLSPAQDKASGGGRTAPCCLQGVLSEKPGHSEGTSADTVGVTERPSRAPSLRAAPPHPLSAVAPALWSGSAGAVAVGRPQRRALAVLGPRSQLGWKKRKI